VISSDAGMPLRQKQTDTFAAQIGQTIDTVFANGSLPPSLATGSPPAVILSPADLVGYDVTRTQQFYGRTFSRTPTDAEIARMLIEARASGIIRIKRLIELCARLDPKAEPYIQAKLRNLTQVPDSLFAEEDRRLQIIGVIQRLENDRKDLKSRLDAMDKNFLDKLNVEYERCLTTFLTTGTLQDTIDERAVDDIFELGQLTVALNLHDLRCALDANECDGRSKRVH
jgi:hypothetical protein